MEGQVAQSAVSEHSRTAKAVGTCTEVNGRRQRRQHDDNNEQRQIIDDDDYDDTDTDRYRQQHSNKVNGRHRQYGDSVYLR